MSLEYGLRKPVRYIILTLQQIPLEVGDGVIVETSKGVEYGEVVIAAGR